MPERHFHIQSQDNALNAAELAALIAAGKSVLESYEEAHPTGESPWKDILASAITKLERLK